MENKWDYFHSYRHLSEEGKVKPLTCPDDNSKLVTRTSPEDEVLLWCPSCDTVKKPGLDVFHQVRAVVLEHSLDILS